MIYLIFDICSLIILTSFLTAYSPSKRYLTSIRNYGSALKQDDVASNLEASLSATQTIPLSIPIINRMAEVSIQKPFGEPVDNVCRARQEISSIVRFGVSDIGEHLRLEYLVKFLESKFVPIQTSGFLGFVIDGVWDYAYSNVLLKLAVDGVTYKIQQDISCARKKLCSSIAWQYAVDGELLSGDLSIYSNVAVTSTGGLALELQEHVLRPNEMPKSPEMLVDALQRSLPHQIFSPEECVIQTTYIDPEIRIARVAGENIADVFEIYLKSPMSP